MGALRELGATLQSEIPQKPRGKVQPKRVVSVAIAGATGFAGGELIALLSRHPFARLVRLMSSGRTGTEPFPVERAHPALRARRPIACHPLRPEDLGPFDVDLVFLATPHETSHDVVPTLLDRGLRVVDLSGAFRLKEPRFYPRWYAFEHRAPRALEEAAYGLTELNASEIQKARLVANPGCYATSVILALAPLVRAGWVDVDAGIICDAKSGASGAGRAPSEKLHFPEVNENLRAYSLFSHRHVPEILQALRLEEKHFVFTPHLLPITRGLLSTVYVRLAARRTLDHIVSLYRDFYGRAPLVRVYDDGSLPEIQSVAHTNYTDLGFALDAPTGRLIIISALDNLGKGAAGQAIQNMNVMFGFTEETGLA